MAEPPIVLLLESHEPTIDLIRGQLERGAFRAFTLVPVPTVAQALDVLGSKEAAVILLDLDLPDAQGLDLFIPLYQNAPSVPIVAFAESFDANRARDVIRAGAEDYLSRSEVLSPQLARALEFAIERHALHSAKLLRAEQLQFSEARFQLLIDDNPDAVLVVNREHVIRYANPAASALLGKPRHELTGTLFELTPLIDGEQYSIARVTGTVAVKMRVVETVWHGENAFIVSLHDYPVSMWGTQGDVTWSEYTRRELEWTQARELHQREMAQALADSVVALNSTLRYEQVLDRILENVGRVVPHDAASIFLIRDGIAHLVRGHGFAERKLQEWVENLRLTVSEIPGFSRMATTGKPLLISDTAADPDWMNLAGDWTRSYVGAPVRVQNETVGFLNLDSATVNFFTPDHALDLEVFAAQAASALENARLHARVQQRAEEFALLYDLTHELGMQRDLETLLDTLVERATRLMNAPSGALALYLPDVHRLEPRGLRGGTRTTNLPRLALGEGLLGRVALSQQAAVVNDYRTWEHRIEGAHRGQASAAMAVPMLFGGELVGVLAVHEEGDTTRRFTWDDVKLLTLLAVQAAALVHNARLHQETEKRAGQMALLYDAGLTLNSVLDPATQLDFLTRIAMRTVRAEFAAFFRFDEMAQELVLAFGLGYSDELPYTYRSRIPLSSEKGIEAWVARERLPANLGDVHADDRFAETQERLMSGVWVPIEHDDRLLGVLAVGSTRVRSFDAHDERLLLLYASQAAVALENARLYQDVRQENERRAVLHRASQEIIGAGLDAEQVYAAIHRASARLMQCEAVVIAVLDETRDRVNLPYVYDREGRKPSKTLGKTQGLAGYVLSQGETVLIGSGGTNGGELYTAAGSEQTSSVLAVPLRHGGQVFGMLSVQSYRQNAYTPGDRVLLEMLAAHAAAALMNVRGAELRLQELERSNLETALALAKAIDARDTYTGAHSDRSSALAAVLAQKLDLSAEDAHAVRLGARLHDIGKIGVPDDILRKPGALTEQEWGLMKRHPEIGAEILALVRPLQRVIPIVKHHQEWYDGSGYPDGLAGQDIPLGARILAVVDAFSAMTDDRSYRKGISRQEAFVELERGAGTQFDPGIVEVFLKLWETE